MKGEGATVFLVVFVIYIGVTIVYPILPPGRQLYELLGVQEIAYSIPGIPLVTLAPSVFNGAAYGFLAWLVFTIFTKEKKPKSQIQSTKNFEHPKSENPAS